MQKRSDRSYGKVPVRLIMWSVCYYSHGPSPGGGRFCFVFVEFNGGSAKATAGMTCRLFFFFFLLNPVLPSPPALCRYPLPLRVVCVRKTAVIFFVLFCPCNRYMFLFSTYGVLLAIAAFPFLSDLLASHSSKHLLFFFVFCFFSVLFSLFSFLLWSGLFCYVLVPGTLALHLLYLD